MAAPRDEYAFDLEAARAAADRWADRADHHRHFEAAVRNKEFTKLDTPERCAARANRLLGHLRRAAPEAAEAVAAEFTEAATGDAGPPAVTAETVTDALLERVIGDTRDFQFVEFLERAVFACRSVGRVVITLGGGRSGFGTGFLVSPALFLTNHHVLPSAEVAGRSSVEFDFQSDRLGRPLAVRTFRLDPAAFFLNDKRLDFALVAVAPGGRGRPLAAYGWCPLIPTLGKIVTGEPINIVQHPKGDRKQVVIRENRLLDARDGADLFLHYEADTEPGSSGSPVFNDQWEVVALHHSGVPRKNARGDLLTADGRVWQPGDDPSRLDWVANEGVRASKLVEFIAAARLSGPAKKLRDEFLKAEPPPDGPIIDTDRPTNREENRTVTDPTPGGPTTLTVPLTITVSLGGAAPAVAVRSQPAGEAPDGETAAELDDLEKVEIDPNYTNRKGYDPNFLGFAAPFPRLTAAARPKAFALPGVTGDAKFVLKYHHYSVIFNKERKLAFVAGVNLDPTAPVHFKREDKDAWSFDGRVPKTAQAGEDLYAGNPLDRGHLVRRADSGWGKTLAEAKRANDDTFHFTNCSPQHAITNQGKKQITDRGRVVVAPPGLKLWGKLEDHVAEQGREGRRKLCVFNGPVFRPDDPEYRGVLIPREFWKLVVFADDAGGPGAAAFVLSQAELLGGLEEEFEVGEYKAVQVGLADLAAKTKLDFGPIAGWDVLDRDGAEESFTAGSSSVVLGSVADIVL